MNEAMVNSYRKDISEFLQDIGTINNIASVTWLKRLHTDFDKTYNASTTKLFEEYTITGAISKVGELDKFRLEGMDITKVSKLLISALEFSNAGIEPKLEDRIRFNGRIYSIAGIPFVSHIGTVDLYYFIYIIEATFAAQTEEYREKADPYYEVNAAQAVWQANDSAINSAIMSSIPAIARGTKIIPWVITAGFNDLMQIHYNAVDQVITVPAAVHTIATALMVSLQSAINTAFGAGIILATINRNRLYIQTVAVGPTITVALLSLGSSCYATFGLISGIYAGKYEPLEASNPAYSDGDPVYDNG